MLFFLISLKVTLESNFPVVIIRLNFKELSLNSLSGDYKGRLV